jgi:hypothetical protein
MPFNIGFISSFHPQYDDFDNFYESRCRQPSRKRTICRLKNGGSDKAMFYEALALSTIGQELWNQMKEGSINWVGIDEEYFRIAEILGEQLERYDPDEVVHLSETAPILETEKMSATMPAPKKQKKKRDRRVKTNDRSSNIHKLDA